MNLGGSIKINKFGLSILCFILLIFILYHLSGSSTGDQNKLVTDNKNTNEINLRKLLIAAICASENGGLEVLSVFNSDKLNTQSKGKTKEGVNDPVTDADFQSHCTMELNLRHVFPKGLRIVSEEDQAVKKCPETDVGKKFDLNPTVLGNDLDKIPDEYVSAEDVTVWIDPLDATKEFTEKLTQYVTTMVCIVVKGKPIIGVIHNPFTHKTTWAWYEKAFSADLGDLKKVDAEKPISLIVSRSHPGDIKDMATKVFGENVQFITAAGAGYKVLQIIFNNATAYVHKTDIKKWDICSGNAILNSLGGKMTDFKGQEITYFDDKKYVHSSGLIATMKNHEMYVEKITKAKSIQT